MKGTDMTIEEAMHELKIQSQVLESMILYNKDFEPKNDNTSLENKKNAIDIGIKALEKQIPYKPKVYEDKYYYCKCGNPIMMKWKNYPTVLMPKSEGLPFCLGCGQAIDWSEEE